MRSLNLLGSASSKTFFEQRLKNRHIRVKQGKIPDLSEKDCLDQQSFLVDVLGPDQDSTLFAMNHGDVQPNNIIVDEEYNITRYIQLPRRNYLSRGEF